MKKLICAVLCLFTIIVSFVPAEAASEPGEIDEFIVGVDSRFPGLCDYIAGCIRELSEEINISAYGVTQDDILDVMRNVAFENPDIFYFDSAYVDFSYERASGVIHYIKPSYIFSKKSIPSCVSKFNKAALKLIDGIPDSWSDYRKVLTLHDRLAVHCEYKKTGLKSYTAYSAIVTRKSICEGYSRAMSYLLSLVGVRSRTINCERLRHCWNMVNIDGVYYHCDVTMDDPIPDSAGYVRHTFFLLSDKKLKSYSSSLHKYWKSDDTYSKKYACSDTFYDKGFFRDVTSAILYKDGAYYYADMYDGKPSVMRRGDNTQMIYSMNENNIESICTTRLCEAGKYIYFNSAREIYRLDTETLAVKRVYKLPSFLSGEFYGIKAQGGYIYAVRKSSSSVAKSPKKLIKLTNNNKALVLPYLRYSSLKLKRGSKFTLKVYAGSGKTSFKSSDTKIIAVSQKGVIKAKRKGTATVTAEKNGIKVKCKVKVI